MLNVRIARRGRALLAVDDAAGDASASPGERDRRSRRRAPIPLVVSFTAAISACGHHDGPCIARRPIDYTFAVRDADFASFVRDDGELDEMECAALCDCLSPVPYPSTPSPDATTPVDASAGEGGADGMSVDGGSSGARCFSERGGHHTYWESCAYRSSAGGYRLVRCVGRTTTTLSCD